MDANTQTILLLTTRLNESGANVKPLTIGEWNKLSAWLYALEKEPGTLLTGDAASLLSGWTDSKIPRERIIALLNRSVTLGFTTEKWMRAGIWFLIKPDDHYPRLLRKRLGMETAEKDDHTRIIIVDLDGKKTGLVVDRVNEVMRLPKTDIDRTEEMVSGMIDTEFIDGIGKVEEDKRVVILLKVGNILSRKEKRALVKMDTKENDEVKKGKNVSKKKQATKKRQQKPKKKKTSGISS